MWPEVEPVDEPSTELQMPQSVKQPRLGFFARLFGRRRARALSSAAQTETPSSRDDGVKPEAPETVHAAPAPEPIGPTVEHSAKPAPGPSANDPVEDLGGELVALEAEMAERGTELLRTVLDALGSAHHRPFSRG